MFPVVDVNDLPAVDPDVAGCRVRLLTQGAKSLREPVKCFNTEKGFGFISPDDGSRDVFVHYSAISGSGYKTLDENQRIQFETVTGQRGSKAENIRPV